ncbi:MAG: type II toxin-antitoxin system VapC family toxin [Gemmatimonadaceae bacterium]|jgi:ribonuclease VapC|nr:type II toxin-antitoxin system VapC family toxin [Gemmatimonadaceae bacterium]
MLLDTSIIVALALAEPETDRLVTVLRQARHPVIGVQSIIEASCVLQQRVHAGADARVDTLLGIHRIEVVELPVEAARYARAAWSQYGKGIGTPGVLNFGDCLVYGHARALGLPLLAKGDDFRRTDLALVDY